MKKIFFAAVFAGALLGFTSCGNREMVTGPEMETVIDSIKETQSGQTTAGTEDSGSGQACKGYGHLNRWCGNEAFPF